MPTLDELRALLREEVLTKADGTTIRKDIGYARDQVRADLGAVLSATDPAKLAAALAPALAAALPAADVVSQDDLEAALRKVLGSVDGATP